MPIHGLTLGNTREYKSIHDDEPEGSPDATYFVLGSVDVFVTASVLDHTLKANEAGETSVSIHQLFVETVRHGLKGWRNFKDGRGKEVPFGTTDIYVIGRKYTVASDECLRQIPMPVMSELHDRIRELSTVTEAEAKN